MLKLEIGKEYKVRNYGFMMRLVRIDGYRIVMQYNNFILHTNAKEIVVDGIDNRVWSAII